MAACLLFPSDIGVGGNILDETLNPRPLLGGVQQPARALRTMLSCIEGHFSASLPGTF